MGPPSVPAGEPSSRHEKVTAFASRATAAAEPKAAPPADHGDLDAFGSEEPKRVEPGAPSADIRIAEEKGGVKVGAERFDSRMQTLRREDFPPLTDVETPREPRRIWMIGGFRFVVLAAGAAVLLALVLIIRQFSIPDQTTRPGRVTIETTPIGTEVFINGQTQGLTPLSVQLDPGTHTITLHRGTEERTISVQVAAGAEVLQHYEFAPQAAAVQTSTLVITTEPTGARVLINGEARGTSPVTVAGLTAALHRVTVVGPNGSVEREVTTEAGVTSSVVFSLPRTPVVSAGWLIVASPFEVQVLERGDLIGTSASPRFMVPAGLHEVDLVNEDLGFNERRRVDINQGATATVKVDARAPISANARPWAEVLVDGRSVGQTPIANLSLPLGSHEIVFRHPDLGERQQTVVVTAKGPNRIAVDLTR